jgi:uncharacterized membrane protein SpoIIM required for sporulation
LVLEHLFSSKRIEHDPWLIAWMAFMFVAIAVSITYYVYPTTSSGLFIITLVVMPAIPFFLHEIITEEKKQEHKCKGQSVFSCYNRLIKFYAYFFIGTVLGFAFCSSLLPDQTSAHIFTVQKNELDQFASSLPAPKLVTLQGSFFNIFFHNLQVLFLMLIFSFIYSIGSIFLLVWNASLVGIFLEQYIRAAIPLYAKFGVLGFPTSFFIGSLNGILRLLPHGIPEITAFFVASISGGIFSIAVERRMFRDSNLKDIFMDAAKLIVISVILLAAGAYIESSYVG